MFQNNSYNESNKSVIEEAGVCFEQLSVFKKPKKYRSDNLDILCKFSRTCPFNY